MTATNGNTNETPSPTTNSTVSQLTDPKIQPITSDQLRALTGDIVPNRVKKNRAGFSYIEAWDVKAALTRIFGFGGWSADLIEWREINRLQVPQKNSTAKMNWQVVVAATLRLTIHQTGATFTEAATGTSSQPDIGASFDMALKSAESFALKRAAINLGTQFGLSLYNSGSLKDVVRVILAPGQERNIPWAAPEEKTEADLEKQKLIDHAFSVHNRPGAQGGHEDSAADEPDSYPEQAEDVGAPDSK